MGEVKQIFGVTKEEKKLKIKRTLYFIMKGNKARTLQLDSNNIPASAYRYYLSILFTFGQHTTAQLG